MVKYHDITASVNYYACKRYCHHVWEFTSIKLPISSMEIQVFPRVLALAKNVDVTIDVTIQSVTIHLPMK